MKHDKEIEKEEKASKKAKKDRGQKKENWFKGYGEATKAELEGRIGSSVKRLIKFIGLSIIPIIYAVICILAFWNPIENIGKANVTFIDQEGEVLLATHKKLADDFNGYLVYGDPAAEIPADDTRSWLCFSIIRKWNKWRWNCWICAKTWLFFSRQR
jgi:hypothetical protein